MKKLALLFCILISLTINAYAQDVIIDTAPSPQYTEYINTPMLLSEDDCNDYQPPILSLVSPAVLQSAELPSYYDAREEDKIFNSGVGQGSDGTCWAFASTLCAETALGATINLSEQHAKYAMSNAGNNAYGYIRQPSGGGNFKMYTAYATSWRGLVLESDDPYKYGNENRDYATVTAKKPVSYHLQETIEIPNPKEKITDVTCEERAAHVEEVKHYVYKYGCCFSSIRWVNTYKSEDGTAYFNNKDTAVINHAICIVGWDDNYPKEKFKEQPKNNGAFIIKNSQGQTGSYCYLSYEDIYAGWDASCVVSVEDKYNYGENYNYNNYESGGSFPVSIASVCTNVFTSKYDGEYISAVGTLTKTRNLIYNVYISTTDDGTEYANDSYEFVAAGVFDMPGYHTVKLDEPFMLDKAGTTFCVRFVFYCNDEPYNVPVELPNKETEAIKIVNINAKPGQSHFRAGKTVYDLGADLNANLFINAFTDADYNVVFGDDVTGTYKVNQGEETPCNENFIAGLNDEITLSFRESDNVTAYYINEARYTPGETVTIKLTEDITITAEKEADMSVFSDNDFITFSTYRDCTDSCLLNLKTEFSGNPNLYTALYKDNKLVGIKSIDTTENGDLFIKTDYSERPDTIKIITLSEQTPLLPILQQISLDIE